MNKISRDFGIELEETGVRFIAVKDTRTDAQIKPLLALYEASYPDAIAVAANVVNDLFLSYADWVDNDYLLILETSDPILAREFTKKGKAVRGKDKLCTAGDYPEDDKIFTEYHVLNDYAAAGDCFFIYA